MPEIDSQASIHKLALICQVTCEQYYICPNPLLVIVIARGQEFMAVYVAINPGQPCYNYYISRLIGP